MRIGELSEKTNVRRETIHHYIAEGYLHKPHKKGKVTAEYDENHVSRLKLIKELRKNHFLPLSVIRDIMEEYEKLPKVDQVLFLFKAKQFRPLEWLMEKAVKGRNAYLEATGIDENWLEFVEQNGIVSPESDGDRPVYTPDDVLVGKLLSSLNDDSLSLKNGLDPEALLSIKRCLQDAVETVQKQFVESMVEGMPEEERAHKSKVMLDLVGLLFYYMNRKGSL